MSKRSLSVSPPNAIHPKRPPGPTQPRGIYAELHLHLGGAILPNILYSYLRRQPGHALLTRYPTFERFDAFFNKKRKGLSDYLAMHSLVEEVQRLHSLRYFIQRLVRGALLFDNLAYVELRYTPYFRTDQHLDDEQRLRQMHEVVDAIAEAAESQAARYPLRFRQILCLHSKLPERVNRAILDTAIAHHARTSTRHAGVVAIDIAGPDALYRGRLPEFIALLKRARKAGLRTTGHVFETADGHYPTLLPHLDRIGHGLQLALHHPRLLKDLARRKQCLELCPTTYLRTGTLPSYEALRPIFARCFDVGVDVAICTDNSGIHQVRVPTEIENLLVRDIIDFHQVEACHAAAYRHAFGWAGDAPAL
jgi:adenosine deaminase